MWLSISKRLIIHQRSHSKNTEAEKEEDAKAKEGEANSSQAAAKEARHTLKERRKAFVASMGLYAEGSKSWEVFDRLSKELDQDIEQSTTPLQ